MIPNAVHHNQLRMLGGKKSYADFLAHITTLAPVSIGWGSNALISAGARRTEATGPVFAEMYGSVWNGYAYNSSSPGRIANHGLPSKAEWDAQVAAGRQMLLRFVAGPDVSYLPSITRNDYTAPSLSAEVGTIQCTELLFWNGTEAMRMQPHLGLGPTPYTW